MHMKVFLEYDLPMNLFHIFPLRVVHAVEYIPNVPTVSVWWCILIKAYCALDISIESIPCFSWHMVLSYVVVFKYIETNSKNNKNARWILYLLDENFCNMRSHFLLLSLPFSRDILVFLFFLMFMLEYSDSA